MTKKLIWLMAAATALASVATGAEEPPAKNVWTLNLAKKSYTLKQALAYETTIDNEEAIVVILSGPAVSSEELKEARKTEKDGSDPSFNRPVLRLVFKKTGELKHCPAGRGAPACPGTDRLRAPVSRARGAGGVLEVRARRRA